MPKKDHMKGFTLIELLIIIAILGIFAGISPNIRQTMNNQRLKSAATNLYSRMQKARSEAIRLNTNIIINFAPGPFASGGGVGTYTVFNDNGDGPLAGGIANNLIQDGTEPTLNSVTMPQDVSLISATFSGGTTAAGFNSRGLPANSRIGSIVMRNDIRWYRISLSVAGNLNMQISSDGVTYN